MVAPTTPARQSRALIGHLRGRHRSNDASTSARLPLDRPSTLCAARAPYAQIAVPVPANRKRRGKRRGPVHVLHGATGRNAWVTLAHEKRRQPDPKGDHIAVMRHGGLDE